MNVTTVFSVVEGSQIAGPRRSALSLAERLGFSEERAGRAALIVSELGTNLVKHARHGEILLRPIITGNGHARGIAIAAVDAGPGIADPARSRLDGYSTAGSLGHGLGAIERQSDLFDLYTHTNGTAIVTHLWSMDRSRPGQGTAEIDVGAVQVAKPGEAVCGDAWSWRARDGRMTALVADGLGHGPLAHTAAQTAVDVFERRHDGSPANVIQDIHAGLRATRGAAVAMLSLDLERGIASYCGLGNIAASISSQVGTRQHLVGLNGTAGLSASRLQEFTYPVPAGFVIVMASDGLVTHWDLAKYPGLCERSADTIAAVLYRDFSRRRDDVTVVVVKGRSGRRHSA